MKTFYDEKDFVSFGNYLLSEKRKQRTSEINRDKVTDADLANWKEEQKAGNNIKEYKVDDKGQPKKKLNDYEIIEQVLEPMLHIYKARFRRYIEAALELKEEQMKSN